MIKIYGILFSQQEDKLGESISLQGTTMIDNMPILTSSKNLIGRMTEYQFVYKAIANDSAELAIKSGLAKDYLVDKDESNGPDYLELKYPFCKIKGVLVENSFLREAIRLGNLCFGIEGIVKERNGNLITSCVIDHVVVGMMSEVSPTKIYLDE